MKIQHRLNGFTLIELMVVIAIIAIIATIAIPSRTGEITQKKVLEAVEMVEKYKSNIEGFYSSAGSFPFDNAAAGMPSPDKILGNYVESVTIINGVLNIKLGKKLPEALHGKLVSIQPVYVQGSPSSPVSWICGFADVPEGMEAAGKNLTNVNRFALPGRCRF